MDIRNRTSDFYFDDNQMQFNHDIRIWVCGAEVSQHLRGSVSLKRSDRNGPTTLNFDLDNVKDIFTITPANKGYTESEDGKSYNKNENATVTPLSDGQLSKSAKDKIDSLYSELSEKQSLLDYGLDNERNIKIAGINDKYNKQITQLANKGSITDKKRNEIEKKKQEEINKVNERYDIEKTQLEKQIQVIKSRLGNLKRIQNDDGSYTYGMVGDFGKDDELNTSKGQITKTEIEDVKATYTDSRGRKKTKTIQKVKLISEELIFNTDSNLESEDVYSDAAKRLIYTNKTILNANIDFGGFLKQDGMGFKPYDLNIDTPIIEKHDPIRVFIKDPSFPFLTNDLESTKDDKWIPLFTGFVDSVTDHTDYLTGDKFLSIACYDIRGIMQRMRVQTNPRISRGTDTALERAEASKKFSVNTGYFTDFFAQSGLGGEKSSKYLHYEFDQVCLEFITGRWNHYNHFLDDFLGKVVSSQSNEVLTNKAYINDINQSLITKNGSTEKTTKPSRNGVGAFVPGAIIECPKYSDDKEACIKTMELWYDILVFGIKGTYYTSEEINTIGCNTLPYGLYDPYNCFVHMITPPNGTTAKNLFDSQLDDLQTGFDYTSRFEFFSKLVERLDYQWFTNSMGDIVIEFPMYDFEPSVFGRYESLLTINKHLTSCVLNEIAGTVYSAVNASGGIQSITGNVMQTIQFCFSAFAKSDQLAYKYGINIEEYSAPNLPTNASPEKLKKQAIIELIKSNVSASSMELQVVYRHAIFPNKPIYCVPKHRMAVVTGFSYNYQINENVSCTIDTAMVRKLTEDNTFINIYNAKNTPIHYLGDNSIELTDASASGIDCFYVDSDNKPTNKAPEK